MAQFAYFNRHDFRVLQWIDTDNMNYVLPDASLLHECSDTEWALRNAGEQMVLDGAIVPYVPPIISASPDVLICSSYQIRQALSLTGLRDQVESAVASGSIDLKDAWEYAYEFRRDNPKIAEVAAALNKTAAEIDALFELAVTLSP
jgi:hypothetical protein